MKKQRKTTVPWDKRTELSNVKWESCRPNLFEAMLSNEAVIKQNCCKCNSKPGLIKCSQCCHTGRLCGACDAEQHQQHPFHDRQYISPGGFFQFLQPTESTDDVGNLINISKCCSAMINCIILYSIYYIL